MNPHQKNKVDISSLSADEQRLFRLYGKLPNKKDLLQNKLKERKYFDSGDYALSKAGKASDTGVTTIGTEHPQAENIPHFLASSPPNSANSLNSPSSTIPLTHTGSMSGGDRDSHFMPGAGGSRGSIHGGTVVTLGGQSRSPVKESSYLARSASVDEAEGDGEEGTGDQGGGGLDKKGGILQQGMSMSPPPVKEELPIRR